MNRGVRALRLIGEPVVRGAAFEAESVTAELSRPDGVPVAPGPSDPLLPRPGAGLRGRLAPAGFVLRRCGPALLPVALVAGLPAHFFAGRVDDTVVAAPALFDLLGGAGLLLLPAAWLAFFAVASLPQVIALAGLYAVAVPVAAEGVLPRPGRAWRLVAYRLRGLWLWFAAFGFALQALQVLVTAGRLGAEVAVPLALVLGLAATGSLTVTGMLGGVLLVERGQGPRRALHLLSRVRTGPLVLASLGMVALPTLGGWLAGGWGSTVAAMVAVLLWAIASLLTYVRARSAEGPVTSAYLLRELALPVVA